MTYTRTLVRQITIKQSLINTPLKVIRLAFREFSIYFFQINSLPWRHSECRPDTRPGVGKSMNCIKMRHSVVRVINFYIQTTRGRLSRCNMQIIFTNSNVVNDVASSAYDFHRLIRDAPTTITTFVVSQHVSLIRYYPIR